MDISSDLADRWYDIMVRTLGSPDDYRRWSFVHTMTKLKITVYKVDSPLSSGVRFHLKRSPIIVCTEELTPAKTMRVQAANQALAKCKIPRRRKPSDQIKPADQIAQAA